MNFSHKQWFLSFTVLYFCHHASDLSTVLLDNSNFQEIVQGYIKFIFLASYVLIGEEKRKESEKEEKGEKQRKRRKREKKEKRKKKRKNDNQ